VLTTCILIAAAVAAVATPKEIRAVGVVERPENKALTAFADPELVELKSDDGTPDGTGIVGDGLMIVNRLTPPRYPAIVKSVLLYFVAFTGDPEPVNKRIRLVVFTGNATTPPASPAFRIDRYVTVTARDKWIEFPIDGPTLYSGDLYVGYETADPYDGVGFACDTSGAQQDRAWYTFDSGATFQGPLRLSSGAKTNVLMRAKVQVQDADADVELRTDDGISETGLLKGNFIAVNRLTPPRYPAKLKTVRLFFEQFRNQPNPVGKSVRVLVFTDRTKPAYSVDRTVTIPYLDQWVDIAVDGPTISDGDFYVGFKTPADPQGIVFSADTDSAGQLRAYYSEDDGATFRGPLALITSSNESVDTNLLIRGVVSFPGSTPATGEVSFEIAVDRPDANIAQGEKAQFRIQLRGEPAGAEVALTTIVETPGMEAVSTTLDAATGKVGGAAVTLEVSAGGGAPAKSATVTITATAGATTRSRTVAVSIWRRLASGVVDAKGGVLEAKDAGVAIQIPPGALSSSASLELLAGDSDESAMPNRASTPIRVRGIPSSVMQPLQVTLPLQSGASSEGVFVMVERNRFLKNVSCPAPMHRILPTQGNGGGARTAEIPVPPMGLPMGDLNLWLVSGYEVLRGGGTAQSAARKRPAATTPDLTFEISYPKELRLEAEKIVELLGTASEKLSFPPDRGLNLPFDRVPNNTIPVSIVYMTDKLLWANKDRYGDSDGETIRFNAYKLTGPNPWTTYGEVPAHELVHVSQHYYGGPERDAGWLWMDDATATWFEGFATDNPEHVPSTAFGGSGNGELNTDAYIIFLREGLIFQPKFAKGTPDNPPAHHGYGASTFLTWLGRRYYPGAGFLSELSRNRVTMSTAEEGLSAALKARGTDLSTVFQSFIKDYMEGRIYPNKTLPIPQNLIPQALDKVATLFATETESTVRFPRWESPDLSAEIYLVKFAGAAKLPDLTDDVVLSFGFAPGMGSQDAGILVTSIRQGKVLGESWERDKPVEIPVKGLVSPDRDNLLITAVNKRNTPPNESSTEMQVLVQLAEPKATIRQRYVNFVGVIGGSYDFDTINQNIPADATYSWNFGDGTPNGTTRSTKHTFTKAGAFEVRLEVSGRGISSTLRDLVTIQIAPDIEDKKSDVTFYVYRVMSSKQKQASQNFSITIFDSNDKPVDSGSAVATNGVWETVLPANRQFKVQVQYVYTLPPCSGKTPLQTFTTKEGLTFVEVETASCGASRPD